MSVAWNGWPDGRGICINGNESVIDLTPRLTARTLHARRKFFDLHVANKSQLAEQALQSIGGLYEVERQERDLSDEDRWRVGKEKGKRPPTHLA